MSAGREARQYTDEERRRATELALLVGPAAAARETSIPKGTLSFWRFQARRSNGGATAGAGAGAGARGPVTPSERTSAGVVASVAPAASTGTPGAAPQVCPPKGPVARSYTPSQRAQALELVARIGVKKAARELGISRFSLHEWRRKAALHARGLAATSPILGSDADPAVERDRKILELWRAHPGLGPSQVRNQLRRAGVKVSVHTTRRVLEDHGYTTPKVRRTEVHDRRYEAVRPNQLWHLDFLHRHIQKLAVYVLLLVDDFSRFIVGAALWDGERVGAVIETFEVAVARHGRPEAAMSDGGSAFYAWRGTGQFTRLLEELGVDQLIARIPETNGKLEVLNANIQKELFNVERFFDLAEASHRLNAWVDFYNMKRTHHALGGLLVPGDRYFGRVARVLAEIEAGRPPEDTALPIPASVRLLDLFRVTTLGGRLEVHLMGERIFPAKT